MRRIVLSLVVLIIIVIIAGLGIFTILKIQTSTSKRETAGNCSTNVYPDGVPSPPPASFHLDEKSTLTICVRFFYYGNLRTVDSSQFMQVTANNSNQTDFSSENENFTVVADSSTFQIGGTSYTNEGIIVTYQIQANANSRGSYMISSLGWLVPSNDECSPDYILVVGNGVPDYVLYGSCITSPVTLRSFGNFSFDCPSSAICTEITGSDNQTSSSSNTNS